jgi:ferredoxin
MALAITDSCINCGYCVAECPNDAIYEPGMPWKLSEGTTLKGEQLLFNGRIVNADEKLPALSDQYYYIVPEKCAECIGVHKVSQCRVVCPDPDSIMTDPEFDEAFHDLLRKQIQLNI